MIRELTIKNYKSILDHTIELGRINVFIGENGCGKTNILEAVAMAAAALTDKLSVEELFNRGMRVAKPSIMRSSFAGIRPKEIALKCGFEYGPARKAQNVELRISGANESAADARWIEAEAFSFERGRAAEPILAPERARLRTLIGDFGLYNATALALRGLQTVSRRTPLGIYGETLDVAISTLEPDLWADVLERAKCVSWLGNITVDPADTLKYEGHKLAGSTSTLYFHDKHMRRRNDVFSAENANEGILHLLFYLLLFVSKRTPKVFGIDNIDTALNPQLCRDVMEQLAELAAKHGKQALITTHNPAILDGLNLHDDEQRLFVVYRKDDGPTVTRRIKVKPRPDGEQLKLSELWMRGHLGGLPRNF
jgi:energy-coupling factor transporter ATP-binding protein EcfA2